MKSWTDPVSWTPVSWTQPVSWTRLLGLTPSPDPHRKFYKVETEAGVEGWLPSESFRPIYR